MKERVPYALQFDAISELIKELDGLKNLIKTQQEAINSVAVIIDELRAENAALKLGVYTQELNNEIAKYKNLYYKANDDYIQLQKRYELLMSKYIKE